MLPTAANGQPAVVAYRREMEGPWRAQDLVVLAATEAGVSAVTAFHAPTLIEAFGFPETLPT